QKSRVPPKPPNPAVKWKRSLWIGAIAGAIVAAVGITLLVHAHRRTLTPGGGAVQVQIATVPPGASIRINGQEKCTSNCNISLPPGNYQVTAFLDGYETAASGISLAAGRPSSVSFPLEPQPQSLRILTDLNSGKVQVDGQPPADLQGGEFVLDKILPGSHTVKLTGRSGQATFSFQIADAKAPEVASGFAVKNLDAVLISSLGNHAKVIANSGPQKLTVNGQAEADTGPAGVDVQHFQSGSDELVIGEGKDQHSVQESFGPAPMLTAIFRSDVNAGTLIVSTGEDDVRVFLNNKEYPRRTRRGQLRIQTIGKVAVRVIKDGFDSPAVQTAEVRKGGETRLEFTLKETPKVASLQISGGIPGAEVLIDNRSLGVLGPGGGIFRGSIPPGNHTIELRHDRFVTRSLQRKFTAGQTVVISGADATLAELHLPPPPKKLPPPAPVKLAPPPPKPGTMADWENNAVWHRENGEWTHQGEGFLAYKLPANGVFTFTVELLKGGGLFHSGKIRWCLNYIDDKNYALFEMDNKNFWAKVVQNGKTFERTKTPLKDLDKQKQFTIQIDVTPEHIVHKIFAGGEWVNLDAWAETGRNFSKGKFGFLMQGDDEIGIRSFKFQPK
ncbi:MAG TPA: PEGA domain-containing protein, partial [Bryobacteraceae bacterium]|nr:PEGA domain-containing protein [Bryobacteraceae bacterium]